MFDVQAWVQNGEGGEKGIHPLNQLNDLLAREWVTETVSVWRQRGLGRDHPDTRIEKLHPAPFSFTDVARLIRFFSKSGHTVLDPFVGIGSTLKAAALEGRSGIGIELNPKFVDLAKERLDREVGQTLFPMPEQQVLRGDARDILPGLDADSVDFVVTSPPYWRILHKKDHKAGQRISEGLSTQYSEDDPLDLGNLHDYGVFIRELTSIFRECARVLRQGRYLAIVVGDFVHKSRYVALHSHLAEALEGVGYALKGITVLYQSSKGVFPYGYPFTYTPNLHHQYILILRNDREPRSSILTSLGQEAD